MFNSFGGFTTLAHRLKKMAVRRIVRGLFVAWYTSDRVRVAVTDTGTSERFTGIKPETEPLTGFAWPSTNDTQYQRCSMRRHHHDDECLPSSDRGVCTLHRVPIHGSFPSLRQTGSSHSDGPGRKGSPLPDRHKHAQFANMAISPEHYLYREATPFRMLDVSRDRHDPTRVSAVGTMLLSLVVAESATLEWLRLIIASRIIRPAGARVSSNLILSRG